VCSPCIDAADGDAACAEKDASTAACGADGACVQCTNTNPVACDGETPVCDPDTSACVGCTAHDQCADTACQLLTGECFEGCVVEVDGDGGADAMTISSALGDDCVVIVHERNGDMPYFEALDVQGDTVAILAAPGESPVVQGTGGAAALSASSGATVYADGMRFALNGSAEGVAVDDAAIWLDRTRIVQNTGGGLTLTNGASATVRNCFVGGNVSDAVALRIDSASANISYSTVVAASFGAGAALRCITPGAVNVRNSIFVMQGADPEIDCDDATVTYTATESGVAGAGNVALSNVVASWFVNLSNDFHLNMPPGDVLTTAQWNTGDAATDIDGVPRPSVDGTADVAGADVP